MATHLLNTYPKHNFRTPTWLYNLIIPLSTSSEYQSMILFSEVASLKKRMNLPRQRNLQNWFWKRALVNFQFHFHTPHTSTHKNILQDSLNLTQNTINNNNNTARTRRSPEKVCLLLLWRRAMPKKQLTRLLSAKFWNTRVSETRPDDDVSTDRKIVKRAEDRVDSDGPPKTTQLELLLAPKATTPTSPFLLAQNVHGVSLSLSPRHVQLKFARGRGGGNPKLSGGNFCPPPPEHIFAHLLSKFWKKIRGLPGDP